VIKLKIGFLDSGIGGLTVLSEALKKIPNHEYLYYADSVHAPYGEKPKEEVRQYVCDAVDFLIKQGAEIVVIACNTATSIAAAELRNKYSIPIIGMEPAVKPAIELSQKVNKRVLVTATPLTLKEEKMKKLLKQYDKYGVVDLCPLSKLVNFAENFDFSDETVLPYLERELSPFNLENYGSIVLGCTHFPLFSEQIRTFFSSDVAIVTGNLGTVNYLGEMIAERSTITPKKNVTFYYSGSMVIEEKEIESFNYILRQLNAM